MGEWCVAEGMGDLNLINASAVCPRRTWDRFVRFYASRYTREITSPIFLFVTARRRKLARRELEKNEPFRGAAAIFQTFHPETRAKELIGELCNSRGDNARARLGGNFFLFSRTNFNSPAAIRYRGRRKGGSRDDKSWDRAGDLVTDKHRNLIQFRFITCCYNPSYI